MRSTTGCTITFHPKVSTRRRPGTCLAPAAWDRVRRNSVINRWHQSWDVPNLYIVDGSALVTGGVVNPTATICALALRAAEHLRDNFRELRSATKSDPG